MKRKLPLVFICSLLLLSSCTRYQYIYLNSSIPKNSKQEYAYENDTIAVSYSFEGQNCPLNIKIYNKLSAPLFVDWRRSSAIVLDENISLWDGPVNEYSEHISMIPPLATTEIQPLNMITRFVNFTTSDKNEKVSYMTSTGLITARRHIFKPEDTPYYFRCYLVYSTEKNFTSENYTDHNFWISGIVSSYSKLPISQPTAFHLQQPTAFSTFVQVTAIAGIIVLGASMSDYEE